MKKIFLDGKYLKNMNDKDFNGEELGKEMGK